MYLMKNKKNLDSKKITAKNDRFKIVRESKRNRNPSRAATVRIIFK